MTDWEAPEVVNTDTAPTYAAALAELKKDGKCPEHTVHRQAKCLTNVIGADHGKPKQLIRPVQGFKTPGTAYATIRGSRSCVRSARGRRQLPTSRAACSARPRQTVFHGAIAAVTKDHAMGQT